MSEIPDKRILVVDDEALVLMALRETLESAGFTVDTCNNPREALEKLRTSEEYPTVISDQRMPEMTGLEFLQEVRRLYPLTARILITGVLRLNTVVDAINQGEIFRFLAKPWLREELIATVENAHQHYLLQRRNTHLQAELEQVNDALSASNRELAGQLDRLNAAHKNLDQEHITLSQNFDRSLTAWGKMLESYMPSLAGETSQIVELCDRIIEQTPMSAREARILKVSARLKNIGYLHVARDIIEKHRRDPANTTAEERDAYQKAPVFGESLAYFVDELNDVGQTIRAQYERFDGTGYPDGLAGENISLPASILAVATAFVESPHSHSRAIESIVEQSGSAYSPAAVEAFLKVEKVARIPQGTMETPIKDLEPGMGLARNLLSPSGVLLFPEGTLLDAHSIERLKRYHVAKQLPDRILVHQDT